MTPREELLATRRLSPAGAALLYKTVRLVALGHGFPPPAGASRWDETEVTEVAHDFLDGDRGRKRLIDITLRSVDDRSFELQLEKSVLNYLRDLARATDLGKLIVRVKEILRAEADFVAVLGKPERWTLVNGSVVPTSTASDKLISAMAGVEVVVPKWTSEHRDPPLADRASFVRLMHSVLAAADGSMTAEEVARTLAARLDHRRTPLTVSLDTLEHVAEPALAGDDPAALTVARLHAVDLFDSFGDRERIIFATWEDNVRDLARTIGTGKTQAAAIRQRLFDRLRDEFSDDDEADGTIAELSMLCKNWLRDRTGTVSATSESLRGDGRGDCSDD